jgi:hypothetical protein
MTTPPLRSSAFRRTMAERIAELRRRWGEDDPLAGRLPMLGRITKERGTRSSEQEDGRGTS